MHDEKEARNAIIKQKMKQEAEDVEDSRQDDHSQQKLIIRDNRREEKAKRRRVNVEIASEILDLVMDVADEAYEF